MTSVRPLDVPALLGEFHRRHPGVLLQISAVPTGSQGLVDALLERRLDLALVSLPGPRPAGITLTELTTSVLDLVVPADHPLAKRRTVPITEFAGLDFVDSPVGYGNRAVADRAFAAASVPRRVTVETTDLATSVAYVQNGLGVALLPRFAVSEEQGVAALTVDDADLDWRMFLAVPSERTPSAAARAMIALGREFLA
ncbi:LysR substrate-binding domain-containing protein [Streptomyces chiangmaiensis]|uniref:LysR substrate-binding domain-containing protein n=2 Tax=Streptomyces chiangmaiensis TaxID=766497 RepID=A0ABU7FTQ6_9ACTN|nr:LysR substrate-binding domain-containing protein [Streptomyces chiangmaiensis]MED7826878.1 LysR substrate-binding domain-containing protein [Streptomyces chiangmaiensis]